MLFAGKSRWDAVLSPPAAQTIIGDNYREAAFPLRSQTERITGHLEQCVSLSLHFLMEKKASDLLSCCQLHVVKKWYFLIKWNACQYTVHWKYELRHTPFQV